MASKVDGTVSPSCFCGLEVDRELEFGDLIEGDLSGICAARDGVSGFELEVVKVLQAMSPAKPTTDPDSGIFTASMA